MVHEQKKGWQRRRRRGPLPTVGRALLSRIRRFTSAPNSPRIANQASPGASPAPPRGEGTPDVLTTMEPPAVLEDRPIDSDIWVRHRQHIVMIMTVWLLVSLIIIVGPSLIPRHWSGHLPSWTSSISTRIIGVILLLFLTLATVAFAIARNSDIRLAVFGSTPELKASGYQKAIGAAIAVLVALIAVFGVLITVESNVRNTNNQLSAQEEAQLNERFQAAAGMLGDTQSAAVRAAGITALAAIADDWVARAHLDPEKAMLRRDQCIRTIEAYLKTPLPLDDTDGDEATHSPEWEQERAVRQVAYKVINDHLWSALELCDSGTLSDQEFPTCAVEPRSGNNWGDHPFDFSHSYLPEATFDHAIFWPADSIDFSSAQFYGDSSFRDARFWSSNPWVYAHAYVVGTSFSHAQFWGSSDFGNSEFYGETSFYETNFWGATNFGATFRLDTSFVSAEFHGPADFSSTFQRVDFSGAQFYDEVEIGSSFHDDSGFVLSEFHGKADFSHSRFECCLFATFSSAQFYDDAVFSSTGFLVDADFSDVKFRDGTPATTGLRDAAELHTPGVGNRAGWLGAGVTIDVGTNESGQKCRLVNDTGNDVLIPDISLVCE